MDEFAKSIQLVVSERSVEADHAQIGIFLVKLNAVKLELAFEPVVAQQKHFFAAVVVQKIFASDLTARVNFVGIGTQSEIVEPCDIIGVHSRRIVGEKANAFAHCSQLVYRGKRAFDFVVADINRAVKVEHEQFYVFDVFHFVLCVVLSLFRMPRYPTYRLQKHILQGSGFRRLQGAYIRAPRLR